MKSKKTKKVEESKANDAIDEKLDKEPINEDPVDENPVDEDGRVGVEDVTELFINLKDITSLNSSSCLKIQQQALSY